MAITIEGEIERVDGGSLTYSQFVERYMKPNIPVVLTGLIDTWQSCSDWVLSSDPSKPNLDFFSSNCSNSTVQVAECYNKEFTDQKRVEMSVKDFISNWIQNSDNSQYLKDWHFSKEYPNYCAYTTPLFFKDDWLNLYLDTHTLHRDSDICPHQNEANCSDYRFVYIGSKGTWTPLHSDVFRSYSWSANVCGKKHWLFLSPSQSSLLSHRKSSVYSVFDDISDEEFPGFKKTVWLECFQEKGEVIFVPSGWYHQVHNLADTISINHNWFNGHNLSWAWNLLVEDYIVAKEYIEDIRDICDDFESICQRNLAANTGMNFYDFFIFVTRFSLANLIELYHTKNTKIAHHFVNNLKSIHEVVTKMKLEEAFSAQNLNTISIENQNAYKDVTKIFSEKCFRELCNALVRTYEEMSGDEREVNETRNSFEKSFCFSINCLEKDCGVIGLITNIVSMINGPEDLIDLIEGFLERSSPFANKRA